MTFYKPWETVNGRRNPSHAYPHADTFEDALVGLKRRRKSLIFHMPNSGEAGEHACVVCGGMLREPALAVTVQTGRTRSEGPAASHADEKSTWTYNATTKQVGNGRHYVCSWTSLFHRIFVAYDAGVL